mgnify:FL=1
MLMRQGQRKKMVIIVSIILCTLFFYITSTMAENEMKEETIKEVQDKLDRITTEEKEVLEYLFAQAQEIEGLEREEKRITKEIKELNQGIDNLEGRIKDQEMTYEKNKKNLKKVLQVYQRMGPGSYIEIILESENLSDLLQRINILRDLTKNTDTLLTTLETSRDRLLYEKNQIHERLKDLEIKQQELKETLTTKAERIKEKEEYLAALTDDRESFLEKLTNIETMMEETKTILADIAKEFEILIKEANFPEDAFIPTFSFLTVKGSIKEEVFNDILAERKTLPEMKITFKPGVAELELPAQRLFLKGHFNIVQGRYLQYEVTEGSFYNMKLELETIKDLFSEGDFSLDLAPLLEKSTIKLIEIREGTMELTISIKLF